MRAELALVAVAFVWGASFTLVKDALGEITPHWLLCLRFTVAFLALGAVGRLARADAATWAIGLGLGALLYVGFALQTVGLQYTTPAKSAFVTGLYVFLVPVAERVLYGRRIPAALGVAVLLAAVGLFLLLHPGSLEDLNYGDVLTLACAVAFALHIAVLGRYAPRLPARELAALQLLGVALLAGPLALAVESPRLEYSAFVWAVVLFLGLGCSSFAIGVQTWAQRRTSASRTALIFALEPVFAVVFSVAVHGERLSQGEWLGGTLMVAGVMLGQGERAQAAEKG